MKADIYYDDLGKDMRVEEIPEDMRDLAEEYPHQPAEAVSDFDDEIMELYLEGEDGSPPKRSEPPSAAPPLRSRWSPWSCGTSYKNKGVQKLLDAIVDYLPSPLDIPAVEGVNPKTGETETREGER